MPIVDNAVYVDGQRSAEPDSLDTTFRILREQHGMAWIGLYRPDEHEIESVAHEFGLHRLAVEDAVTAHQRPKLDRYDGQLFMVLRPARYDDDAEKIELGELHVFVGDDFVVTIRHAESPELARVRERLEAAPELLRLGPSAVLYGVLDQLVDEYEPVVDELRTDTDQIEDQLFSMEPTVSKRIYKLSQEAAEFQRAVSPLVEMIESLLRGSEHFEVDVELQRNLRDVLDHCIHVAERVDSIRATLQNALTVNATLVAQQQNDEMRAMTEVGLQQNEQVKRISSWGAILFAPSLIAAIYGMNFEHIPELHWRASYPVVLLAMAACAALLYVAFRKQKWL